jgi:hypothetical protein
MGWGQKGAGPGAVYGSTLGPWGTVAGAATGAAAGASVGMLYKVGGLAISETTGISEDNQKRLRDLMEKANENTQNPKKR